MTHEDKKGGGTMPPLSMPVKAEAASEQQRETFGLDVPHGVTAISVAGQQFSASAGKVFVPRALLAEARAHLKSLSDAVEREAKRLDRIAVEAARKAARSPDVAALEDKLAKHGLI